MTSIKVKRGCLKKRRYEDLDAARKWITFKQNKGAPQLSAYECKVCKGWHLTKRIPNPSSQPRLDQEQDK